MPALRVWHVRDGRGSDVSRGMQLVCTWPVCPRGFYRMSGLPGQLVHGQYQSWMPGVSYILHVQRGFISGTMPVRWGVYPRHTVFQQFIPVYVCGLSDWKVHDSDRGCGMPVVRSRQVQCRRRDVRPGVGDVLSMRARVDRAHWRRRGMHRMRAGVLRGRIWADCVHAVSSGGILKRDGRIRVQRVSCGDIQCETGHVQLYAMHGRDVRECQHGHDLQAVRAREVFRGGGTISVCQLCCRVLLVGGGHDKPDQLHALQAWILLHGGGRHIQQGVPAVSSGAHDKGKGERGMPALFPRRVCQPDVRVVCQLPQAFSIQSKRDSAGGLSLRGGILPGIQLEGAWRGGDVRGRQQWTAVPTAFVPDILGRHHGGGPRRSRDLVQRCGCHDPVRVGGRHTTPQEWTLRPARSRLS